VGVSAPRDTACTSVGSNVGFAVGEGTGFIEGDTVVGWPVVGKGEGTSVGATVVGWPVEGKGEGAPVGALDGLAEGSGVVGSEVGLDEGVWEG